MAVITKTLKASGGDYSLMSTWEATEQTSLTGDTHILECYNDWPSGLADHVVIAGWTNASATEYITIRAAASNGHGGTVGAGFWIAGSTAHTIESQVAYTRIEGIESSNSGGTYFCIRLTSGGYQTVHNCITSGSGSTGVSVESSNATTGPNDCRVSNCLSVNLNRGFYLYGINNTVGTALNAKFYNLTAINNATYGIRNGRGSSSSEIKNCVVYNSGTGDFTTQFAGASALTEATNDNSDASTFTGGATPLTGTITSADFTNLAGGDYTPASAGDLAGTGTDLSGTFTDDITGTTRVNWDIGAYEYFAAGLSAEQIIAMRRKPNTPLIAM